MRHDATTCCGAQQGMPPQEFPEASPGAGQSPRSLRILLVEDDVMSQQVALRLLERLGHRVEIAASGPAALAKLSAQAFDVALMDVQLPGMNGFDVTAHWRDYERTKGGHLPIIAVTARAFPEDRARCLAAGMDAYVTKPIQAAVLYATLHETLREEHFSSGHSQVIDIVSILQSVGGDRTLLRELGQLFLLHVPRQREALREALQQGLPEAVERAAHALRGSMATFRAHDACHLLERLVAMGRARQLQEVVAMPVFQALHLEIERFLTLLRTPGWDVPAF